MKKKIWMSILILTILFCAFMPGRKVSANTPTIAINNLGKIDQGKTYSTSFSVTTEESGCAFSLQVYIDGGTINGITGDSIMAGQNKQSIASQGIKKIFYGTINFTVTSATSLKLVITGQVSGKDSMTQAQGQAEIIMPVRSAWEASVAEQEAARQAEIAARERASAEEVSRKASEEEASRKASDEEREAKESSEKEAKAESESLAELLKETEIENRDYIPYLYNERILKTDGKTKKEFDRFYFVTAESGKDLIPDGFSQVDLTIQSEKVLAFQSEQMAEKVYLVYGTKDPDVSPEYYFYLEDEDLFLSYRKLFNEEPKAGEEVPIPLIGKFDTKKAILFFVGIGVVGILLGVLITLLFRPAKAPSERTEKKQPQVNEEKPKNNGPIDFEELENYQNEEADDL